MTDPELMIGLPVPRLFDLGAITLATATELEVHVLLEFLAVDHGSPVATLMAHVHGTAGRVQRVFAACAKSMIDEAGAPLPSN